MFHGPAQSFEKAKGFKIKACASGPELKIVRTVGPVYVENLYLFFGKTVGMAGNNKEASPVKPVAAGILSFAGQDPKQRVRVLHGVRGHQ